jgi:hypothetical protein
MAMMLVALRDLFCGPIKGMSRAIDVPALDMQAANPRQILADGKLILPELKFWLLESCLARVREVRVKALDHGGTPTGIWSSALEVCDENAIACMREVLKANGFPWGGRIYLASSSLAPNVRDLRRLVDDPTALKKFVDTVIDGDIQTLPTQSQQSLARDIRACLDAKRDGRRSRSGRTVNGVIDSISKLTKHDWKGIAASTLKDNYYRPPGGPKGSAPRTSRARQAALRSNKT